MAVGTLVPMIPEPAKVVPSYCPLVIARAADFYTGTTCFPAERLLTAGIILRNSLGWPGKTHKEIYDFSTADLPPVS
jgi:hypothetical protein